MLALQAEVDPVLEKVTADHAMLNFTAVLQVEVRFALLDPDGEGLKHDARIPDELLPLVEAVLSKLTVNAQGLTSEEQELAKSW